MLSSEMYDSLLSNYAHQYFQICISTTMYNKIMYLFKSFHILRKTTM